MARSASYLGLALTLSLVAGCATRGVVGSTANDGSVRVQLNDAERAELMKQPPGTARNGGFQNLLVSLQARLDARGDLILTSADRERIPRYAFDYRNGGWENRLEAIFARSLGPKLGR